MTDGKQRIQGATGCTPLCTQRAQEYSGLVTAVTEINNMAAPEWNRIESSHIL